MLTTLRGYLGSRTKEINAILAPLTGIVAELEKYLETAKVENEADRKVVTETQDRIAARSREMERAGTVKKNVASVIGLGDLL